MIRKEVRVVTSILRSLDMSIVRLVSYFFILFNKNKERGNIKDIKKILVIRPGGAGDAICTLPFLEELRNNFLGAEVQVVCMKRNKDFLEKNSLLNKLIVFDETKVNPFYVLKFLSNLRKENFDLVFDLAPYYRFTALMSYITKAGIRIGFPTNERKYLYTRWAEYLQDKYEVFNFLDQLRTLGLSIKDRIPVLKLPKEDRSFAKSFFKKNNIKKGIAIAPAASKREKFWPIDNFVGLINKFKNPIILLGSKDEKRFAEHIIKNSENKKVISLVGKIDFWQSAAILEKCDLLITPDSAPMHIAMAVNTPTISLFGPTIEKKWAPKGERHFSIVKDLACVPCAYNRFAHIPKCKKGMQCMKLITVEDVLNIIRTQFRRLLKN